MPGPAGDFSRLIDTEPIRSLDMPANAQRDPDATCIIRKSDVNCPDPEGDSE
jgi:hypothetical protein